MHYIGQVTHLADAASGSTGEGPIFTHQEPAAEDLLFARAVWGLGDISGIPAASPRLDPDQAPTSDAEKNRLRDLWTHAWDSVWAMYASSYDSIRSQDVVVVDVIEPLDWRSMISPSSLSFADFPAWRQATSSVTPFEMHYAAVSVPAEAAYRRGLSCVFVLPVNGDWSMSVRSRIMLISSATYESTALLTQAFEKFEGGSAPDEGRSA